MRKEPQKPSPRLTCQTRILKSTAFRFSIAIFSKFVSLNGPAFRVTNACRNSNFSLSNHSSVMQKFCPAPKKITSKTKENAAFKRYLHFHLNDAIFDLNLRLHGNYDQVLPRKKCCKPTSATGSVFVEAKATGTTSRTTSCATNKQTSWDFGSPLDDIGFRGKKLIQKIHPPTT